MGPWERWQARVTQHRFRIDALLAAFVALVALVVTGQPYGAPAWLASLGGAAVVAPLAWRRTRPVASAATVYVVGLLHVLAGAPLVLPADLAVLVALYSVTVYGPRWAHRTAMAGAAAGSVVLGVAVAGFGDVPTAVVVAVFALTCAAATWAFGLLRRARADTMAALVDRARRLEVERDQQGRLAAAAERARIAREMHDIVAHSLTVIIAQADGGRYAAAADPDVAARTLGTVAETGRAALADMRRLLGVLRTEEAEPGAGATGVPGAVASVPGGAGGAGGTGGAASPTAGATTAAPTAPLPSTDDLEELVARVRAGGLRVSLARVGTPRTLPPGAGLTVYRIAQEALTNVLKHAGPDPHVAVQLQWRADGVLLEVVDDGRGAAADPAPVPSAPSGGTGPGATVPPAPPAPGPGESAPDADAELPDVAAPLLAAADGLGLGLRGMRERAALFGGTVSAGPRRGGGFRVVAHLPTPPVRAAGVAPRQPGTVPEERAPGRARLGA
ncbi:sensor histidine kinase [Cellulomonas endophytica]|uniref:sensor histidine kinase n=1 Tax=Cellulomonas endophytica TaxID=2494735 RepID=UPI001010E7D0|nr:histidine kinase [Cellulomonas endophytica]